MSQRDQKQTKDGGLNPKVVKLAEERLEREVTNQLHPLDKLNWLQLFTFTYLSPIYQYIGAGLDFKPELNFRPPKAYNTRNCSKKVENLLQGDERLLWKLFKQYKYDFIIEFTITQLCGVIEMVQLVNIKNTIDSIQAIATNASQVQPLLQDGTSIEIPLKEASMQSALFLIFFGTLLEILRCVANNLRELQGTYFDKKVDLGFDSFLFEEQLGSNFNDIHANRFKVDISQKCGKIFRNLCQAFRAIQSAGRMLFVLYYGFAEFGRSFSIMIFGVVVITYSKTKLRYNYVEHNKTKQEKEIEVKSTLSSVFDNLQYIKINTLENFYFRKNADLKHQIGQAESLKDFWEEIYSLIISLMEILFKCLFLGAYLMNGGLITAGTINVFLSLNNYVFGYGGLRTIIGSFWQEIFAEEKLLDEICVEIRALRESQKKKVNGFDGSGEEVEAGGCLLKGNYYWNLNEEEQSGGTGEDSVKNQDQKVNVDSSGRRVGFELKDIDFRAERCRLTMIIGKIGSGKSSLLQALLGEMNFEHTLREKPSWKVNGSVAYLGQKPWIMNATVKENILLGKQYKEEFFDKCLRYSALKDDLTHWERGIEHIVGEGGVALSGGQKARLALARCLYQDADIYLIDDVTSALDVHVGGMVFNKTIREFLKEKTVVMTTHNIQFLEHSDYIYCMDQGRISHQGKLEDIKGSELFEALIEQKEKLTLKQQQEKIEDDENEEDQGAEQKEGKEKHKEKEDKNKRKIPTEKVSSSNLVDYFLTPEEDMKKQETTFLDTFRVIKNLFGSELITAISLIALTRFMNNYSNVRLSKWANNFKEVNTLRAFMVYNLIGVIAQLITSVSSWQNSRGKISQTINTSSRMLYRVLHSNLEKFTDKIPKSTMIDKIGSHENLVELRDILWHCFGLASTILVHVLNIYGQIGSISALFIGSFVYYICFGNKQKLKFGRCYEIYKRIPSRAKSNYYSEVKNGLVPLKAMKLQGYLRKKFYRSLESLVNFELLNGMVSVHKMFETDLVKSFVYILPSYLVFLFFRAGVKPEEVMVALFVQSAGLLSGRFIEGLFFVEWVQRVVCLCKCVCGSSLWTLRIIYLVSRMILVGILILVGQLYS